MQMNIALQRNRLHFMYDIYCVFYHNTICGKIAF